MSAHHYHVWISRIRCNCGYTWTTPGSGDVTCGCGGSGIANHVPYGTQLSVNEDDFKIAVAADIGVAPEDLVLVQE